MTLIFRNYYWQPKKPKGLMTIRLVRLMSEEYNPGTFLKQIVPYLTVGIDVRVKVGFSFIAVRYEGGLPEFSYFFAAEDLCTINKLFLTREKLKEFADNLEKMTHDDLLHETFLASKSGERFTDSGFTPFQLIANYIWIRK